MMRDDESEIPRAPEDPPYQAITPNLDRVSASSMKPGSVSRRRIMQAVLVLVGVALVVTAVVTWSMYLS
jgi:FtsH-binding integral membrane protein